MQHSAATPAFSDFSQQGIGSTVQAQHAATAGVARNMISNAITGA